MRQLLQTSQFVRDIRRMTNRGKDLEKMKAVVRRLAANLPLEPRHRDHPLGGSWKESRDCHIEPDWLLRYTITETPLCLERTGTHSDLFE